MPKYSSISRDPPFKGLRLRYSSVVVPRLAATHATFAPPRRPVNKMLQGGYRLKGLLDRRLLGA